MRKTWPLLLLLLLIGRNLLAQQSDSVYTVTDSFPREVGDIMYGSEKADSSFTICNPSLVFQYYNTRSWYLQHKSELEAYFRTHYKPVTGGTLPSGYIIIRFIIICSGNTGCFRVKELDNDYNPCHFEKALSGQHYRLLIINRRP